MPARDDFDDLDSPDWLKAVAEGVDELVGDAPTMNRFRRMLRDWKAEHEARGPKSPKDKRGNVQHNPVELLPRRMTLREKYAALAAIHDAICKRTKRIDPWTTHKRIRHFGSPKVKASWSYTVLCSRVAELADTDRERIEGVLRNVKVDLAATTLIDRLARAFDPPRLSDGDLARLRAFLQSPPDLPELQAGRNRRRRLAEVLRVNDELRRTGAGDSQPLARDRQWKPRRGYVGTKTICHGVRFCKGGKNPRPSTIQRWVERAEREGKPVKIDKALDTGENHYPESWIAEQIERWSPRSSQSSEPGK